MPRPRGSAAAAGTSLNHPHTGRRGRSRSAAAEAAAGWTAAQVATLLGLAVLQGGGGESEAAAPDREGP